MHKRYFVRDRILDLLEGMNVGDPIPPERDLCVSLGVARATVRNAITELVREGRLERRQGSGTYVAQPKRERRPAVASFTETVRDSGLEPSSRTLSTSVQTAGAQLGRRLEISPRASVVVVRRLRLANGTPMAIETLHVPADVAPRLESENLETQSFYTLLADRWGVTVSHGVQSVEPTVLDDEEARLLGVPVLSPAFLFELTTRTADRTVVEFVRSVHRGDRFKLLIELDPRESLDYATPIPAARS